MEVVYNKEIIPFKTPSFERRIISIEIFLTSALYAHITGSNQNVLRLKGLCSHFKIDYLCNNPVIFILPIKEVKMCAHDNHGKYE